MAATIIQLPAPRPIPPGRPVTTFADGLSELYRTVLRVQGIAGGIADLDGSGPAVHHLLSAAEAMQAAAQSMLGSTISRAADRRSRELGD
jgi:hypothetical protein